MPDTASDSTTDIAILGGGIAGLWLLNRLRLEGHGCVLLEKHALGSGQTLASQGMIHGGIKYTLGGKLTGASETIAAMPDRWRRCLEGRGELDLTQTRLLSDRYYLFSDGSLTSRVTAFFGSKAVEGRVNRVEGDELPAVFQHPGFSGNVYLLQDVVVDTPSLIRNLAEAGGIVTGSYELRPDGKDGYLITLSDGRELRASHLVLAAGEGNAALIRQLSLPVQMQLRPLNQVIVTGDHLPVLYAHAVSLKAGDKPRVTITTHVSEQGASWYLGGQLAESGVKRDDDAQCRVAVEELERLFPWLDFDRCEVSTLRINRAEAAASEGLRPDTPFVATHGNVTVCFPTKLTLAPLLGDQVVNQLQHVGRNTSPVNVTSEPAIGTYPWL